jgi:hypothetical protein
MGTGEIEVCCECGQRVSDGEECDCVANAPFFGHKSGKTMQTHWITFLKPNASGESRGTPLVDRTQEGETWNIL